MMTAIAVLAGVGILLSFVAWGCVEAHVTHPKDARLLGMPWATIGMLGYAAIVASVFLSTVTVTNILVFVLGVTTLWLAQKAIKIRLDCPICPMTWVLNAVIVVLGIANVV